MVVVVGGGGGGEGALPGTRNGLTLILFNMLLLCVWNTVLYRCDSFP